MKKQITILGATGSIGVSTLDVISQNRDSYEVKALTANKDYQGLCEQCIVYQPDYAVMADVGAAKKLDTLLKERGIKEIIVLAGAEALVEVASLPEVDYVMAAIVGAAGLLPTLAAAQAGKRVLLANKEALVMSGELFMQAVRDNEAELLPIDSEHNAIFQCLPNPYRKNTSGINKILLTGSGGPFLTRPIDSLANVSPDEACAHPNWSMGRKISVDSATMMNKGLEVIEASWLFGLEMKSIDVVIHPQSIIHSMVEYADGSVLAQLGNPDMRTPIAHAMAWPARTESGVQPLNFAQLGALTFEETDTKRFPCLELAYQAGQSGGAASTILNAANEVAVENFLNSQMPFNEIAQTVAHTLDKADFSTPHSIEEVIEVDQASRTIATKYVHSLLVV